MHATNQNNLGKLEKNKSVKEGPCIFPFVVLAVIPILSITVKIANTPTISLRKELCIVGGPGTMQQPSASIS